jgi:hypothetical protein
MLMRIEQFETAGGVITARHGLATEDVAIWVERPDGVRVQPFFALALDADRVEVSPVPGVPVAAVIVERLTPG